MEEKRGAGPGAGGRGQWRPPGGAVPAPPARGARGLRSRDQKRALQCRAEISARRGRRRCVRIPGAEEESSLCVGRAGSVRPLCAPGERVRSGSDPSPRGCGLPRLRPAPLRTSPHLQRSLRSCCLGPPQRGHLFRTLLALPRQLSPGKPSYNAPSRHHVAQRAPEARKVTAARGAPGAAVGHAQRCSARPLEHSITTRMLTLTQPTCFTQISPSDWYSRVCIFSSIQFYHTCQFDRQSEEKTLNTGITRIPLWGFYSHTHFPPPTLHQVPNPW